MTLLAGPTAETTPQIVLFDTLAAAAADWRAIEAHGVLTPYQRLDWIAGLLAAGAEPGKHLAIAVIRAGSNPVALLPLVIERRWGIATARLIGTHQSNSDWLATTPDFAPSPQTLAALIAGIARAAGGIDLLTLFNQPESWQGQSNPMLALARAPGASNLYTATIGPTPVPYVEHRLNAKRRNNIKRGARRIEEMLGSLRVERVADAATLDTVHAVFLAQRGERFGTMGVHNIFAEDHFVRFFRQTAIAGFGQRRPALCLHALYAGDTIVATCWGAMAGDHYSQYINSTMSGPAAKYSLMAVLVAEVMDDLTAAGIVTFDMGLGDFDYKHEWTEPQPVFHSVIPLTAKGRLAAHSLQLQAATKRLIKQTPAFWAAAKWLRLQRRRLTGKN